MIGKRRIKQGLLALLITSIVVVTFKCSLETSWFKKTTNNNENISMYFTSDDLISQKPMEESNSTKSRLSKEEFSHSKKTLKRSEKNRNFSKCDNNHCPIPREDFINIYLVPHSHNDPGYKKTMHEYFYGLRNDIYNVSIVRILDSVIEQLTLNTDRKFIYAEVAFFSKWWKLQTEDKRRTVHDLIRTGRFEFINGGWCVNDEAAPNYVDIIDQMSLGLNFLTETFGECGRPKVAFQADTFGHSREQALLSSLMGFDGLIVGRVDEEDKKRRIESLEMEFIWAGSDIPGKHPNIFTGITYNVFDPPPGFCFDNICGNNKISQPINDDIDSKGYNVEEKADEFLEYCWKQADAYKTNNIVIYMGSDFTYEYAEVWYNSMDKLIKHINLRQQFGSPFNIFYSTPTCYLKALNEAKVTWPTKTDDFFPFHGLLPGYWTGYFSSRPALKYMVRQGSSLLQACKQMTSALKLKYAENKGDISVMKEAMAILQHHDAITGTHSQRVSDDYVRMLHKGVEECRKTMNSYYQSELPKTDESKKSPLFSISYCNLLNMSQCEATERKGESVVVNIYNPLGQYISKYIRFPILQEFNNTVYNFRVIDSNDAGLTIPSQLMPIASFVTSIPGRKSLANHELIFMATKVPPLGSKSYYIEVSVGKRRSSSYISVAHWNSFDSTNILTDVTISNKKLSMTLSKETGLITSVTILGKKKIPLDQQFFWYNSNGDHCNFFSTRVASGVYVFNPLKDMALRFKMRPKTVSIYKGDLVEEIHQTINDYIGQTIRLYKENNYIEFDWVVGPVPTNDGVGKEIITRYTTDFENNGTFYTDANGRQNVLRIRDFRQTYKLDENDPVASNYYPITSHVFMTDLKSGYRMSVLTDRAQGGGSVEDGQLELMIHRRLVQQEFCLFKEPLDEIAHGKGIVVRGTHVLFFEDTQDEKKNKKVGSNTLRSLALERSMQTQISFFNMNYTFQQWIKSYRAELQFLSQPLPKNVKLLTFESFSGQEGEYILRLEHVYDVGEHFTLSTPVEISLKNIFKGYSIEDIKEVTLDGNLMKTNLKRFNWKSTEKEVDVNFDYQISSTSQDPIKLMPMEIRTFIIKLLAND